MTERRHLPLTGQLLVRVPAPLAARLQALAAAEDITSASWCRRCITAAAQAAPDMAVPIRAYRQPLPPSPAHVLEVARLREVVGELSGLLKQAAMRTRLDDRPVAHAEIDTILPRVRAAVLDLDRVKIAMLGSH